MIASGPTEEQVMSSFLELIICRPEKAREMKEKEMVRECISEWKNEWLYMVDIWYDSDDDREKSEPMGLGSENEGADVNHMTRSGRFYQRMDKGKEVVTGNEAWQEPHRTTCSD